MKITMLGTAAIGYQLTFCNCDIVKKRDFVKERVFVKGPQC